MESEETGFAWQEDVAILRHEIRTLLNHIAGYSEILKEDALEYKLPEFEKTFDEIHSRALAIRGLVSRFLGAPGQEDILGFKDVIAEPLYDIIRLVQTARNACDASQTRAFLPDIEKILSSTNNILEIFERRANELDFFGNNDKNEAKESCADGGPEEGSLSGTILVVDDNEYNRDMLGRYLKRQGHSIITANNGIEALDVLRNQKVDLVMLDYMMPVMNGYQVLEIMHNDPVLRDIPAIIISMLDTRENIAKCILMGAEDYMPKEFDPMLLSARINACLKRKRENKERDKLFASMIDTQSRIAKELAEAATYVGSLLPQPMKDERLEVTWTFVPSLSLGGDIFGYHWLDEDRFAVFLLDVSGHGVEAALLSVSIMNMLNTQAIVDTDFGEPSSVLRSLNRSFKIEEQNNMFFSIWYGVYSSKTRKLRFSSGGSSPAVIFAPDSSARELSSNDMIIGVDQEANFGTSEIAVPLDAHLYLFSDGIYEIRKKNSEVLGLSEFINILRAQRYCELNSLLSSIKALSLADHFEDDVSLVRINFK